MINASNFHLTDVNYYLEYQPNGVNVAIVRSLQFVITHFFLKASATLTMTVSCRVERRYNYFRLILAHLLQDMPEVALQLVVVRKGQPAFVAGERHHNLYLVDSLQAFLDIDPVRYVAHYNTNEYYYIFLQEFDALLPQSIDGILNYCWTRQLINCNVQVQTAQGQLLVYTYFPFTSQHCGRVEVQLVNEFVRGRMLHAPIFPQKLRNMHQCPLRVMTWSNPPFVRLAETPDGEVIMSGFEARLLQAMALHLNFSIRLVDAIDPNASANGEQVTITMLIKSAFMKLKERTADITLGYVRANSYRNQMLSSLHGHYQVVQVICVLRSAQQYSSLEILGFPFRKPIWRLLLLLLLCGLIAARLRAARSATKHQLDLIAIALGLPTTRPPGAHHKRIAYLNWTLATFVLRSVYIAVLYDLFCKHLYRQPPDSIAGLLQQNFSVVVNRDVYWGLKGIALFSRQNLAMKILESSKESSAFEYLERQAASGRNLAAIGARDGLLNYGLKRHKAGMFYILPEAAIHQQLAIYVSKHSFAIDQLNELLLWIQAVGLMECWLRVELDLRYFHSTHMQSKKYFGQQELSGIYYICGVLLLLALMVFLVELLVGRKRSR